MQHSQVEQHSLLEYGSVTAALEAKTGLLFQSDNLAYASANAAYGIGTTFSVAIWAYITDLTTEQILWCKQMYHTSSSVSNRACIKIKSSTMYAGLNSGASGSTGTYAEVNLALVPILGWNFIAVGFTTSGAVSTAIGWLRKPDGTQQNGVTKTFTLLFQDSVSFLMTAGGGLSYASSTFSVIYGFKGVINNIRFYNYLLTTAMVDDSYLNSCNSYCLLCRMEDSGACIEEYSTQKLVHVDFNVPDYRTTIDDQSGYSNNFALSGTTTTDPYYVHNQGLYFDGTNSVSSAAAATGSYYFAIELRALSYVRINVNSNYVSFLTTYANAVDVEKWHFISVAVIKYSSTQTQICFIYDTSTYTCSSTYLTTIYSDTGTNIFTLGSGFTGMIRVFDVYDYPKMFESTAQQIVSVSSSCTSWNSISCSLCDKTYSSQCFSTCGIAQYGDSCSSCNSNCLSCYSNLIYTCFACQTTTHTFITSDTYCQEICGDGKNYGIYQCDDGNTVNGDGCNARCAIETGYTCSGGSTTTADTCTEICGDGYNLGTYGCDDGNTVDGDGCSSTCTVESYYVCANTALNSPSDCYEICGDSTWLGIESAKSKASFACDDGNTDSGDGCNQYCLQETGYTCDDTTGKCTEICGDGIAHTDACDDGGTLDGDGCSSTCAVEPGWKCVATSSNAPSVCYAYLGPSITGYTLQRDDSSVTLQLDDMVYLSTGFTQDSSLKLYITGPEDSYDIAINFSNDIASNQVTATNQLSFSFTIGSDVQLYGDGYETDIYSSTTSQALTNPDYSVPLYGRDVTSSTSVALATGVGAFILVTLVVVIAGWIALGIMGFPIAPLWHVFIALQVPQLLPITQSNMPTEAKKIGKLFSIVNFSLGDAMATILGDMASNPDTLYKYYYYGYYSYNGFLDLIDTIMIAAIVAGGCYVLSSYLKNSPPGKTMHYLSVRVQDSMIPFIATIAFTRVCFVGFLGAFNADAGGTVAPIVGAVILAACIAFLGYTFGQFMLYKGEVEGGKNSPGRRWRGFFGYFLLDKMMTQLFYCVFMVKRVAWTAAAAGLLTLRPWQMVTILILQFVWMLYIFKYKPYKEKYFNILALIDEIGAFLCTGLMSNFVFLNGNLKRTQQMYIGLAFGGVVELVLILNIVFMIVYYNKRKPPEFEYKQEFYSPKKIDDDKDKQAKVPLNKKDPKKKDAKKAIKGKKGKKGNNKSKNEDNESDVDVDDDDDNDNNTTNNKNNQKPTGKNDKVKSNQPKKNTNQPKKEPQKKQSSKEKPTPSKKESTKKPLKVEKNPKSTKKTPNEIPDNDDDYVDSLNETQNNQPDELVDIDDDWKIEKGQNVIVEDSHYVKPAGLETRINSNFVNKAEWDQAKVNKPYQLYANQYKKGVKFS